MTSTSSDLTPGTMSLGRRILTTAAKRWPTVVGIGCGADIMLSEVTDQTTFGYGEVLVLLPLLYLVSALLRKRHWSWPLLLALLALFVGLRLQEWVEPSVVLLAVALGAAIWGAGHGRHREPEVRLQLAGMVGFAALAVAGLALDPDIGRYLVAAGWLGHGVWDFVHLARERVVSRSYAEWCGTFDVIVGAGLIIIPAL